MSKRFELLPDEEVISDEPIHWKNYLSSLLAIALCTFLAMLRTYFHDVSILNKLIGSPMIPSNLNRLFVIMELTVLIVIIILLMLRTMDISYIHYYLTTKRIIATSGIINRQFSEMLLAKCEMVYLTQNAYERMYNCGDILCVSAGASLFLDDVKNAVAFKQRIMSLMSEQSQNSSR